MGAGFKSGGGGYLHRAVSKAPIGEREGCERVRKGRERERPRGRLGGGGVGPSHKGMWRARGHTLVLQVRATTERRGGAIGKGGVAVADNARSGGSTAGEACSGAAHADAHPQACICPRTRLRARMPTKTQHGVRCGAEPGLARGILRRRLALWRHALGGVKLCLGFRVFGHGRRWSEGA